MNPLLKDRRALALYLGVCLLVGAFFASLLVMQGEAPWSTALVLALPIMLVFGFMSLSAWPVSRAFPLRSTDTVRVFTAILLSSAVSSVLWTLLAVAWSLGTDRIMTGSD
ncbi:MAG TPA: hypothetical protein VF889_07460, partial [Bacteroidota bacterium]